MDMREAAQTALDVQDACNLSGVAYSLSRILEEVIWPEARRIGEGTDFVNTHPIVTLFLDKLLSLNRTQCLCSETQYAVSRAYDKVRSLAEGKEVK